MGGFPNCGKEENSVQTCALRSWPRSHERAGVVVQTRGMSLDHQMWQSPPGGGREGHFLAGYILSLLDRSPMNLNSEHVQVPSSEAAIVPIPALQLGPGMKALMGLWQWTPSTRGLPIMAALTPEAATMTGAVTAAEAGFIHMGQQAQEKRRDGTWGGALP